MTELYNFDLQVSGTEADGYTVQVRGPAGEWASEPLNGAPLVGLEPDLDAIQSGQSPPGGLERLGAYLFQALFPPNVTRVYDTVRSRAEQDGSLRLRLHLPAELATLPWELLYDRTKFLCLDATTSIVRFLDLPDPPPPLAVEPPLHLLHFVASPKDAPQLDVERETAQIAAALAELTQAGKVEILPGRPGTLSTLQDQLRRDCHIVHFSGHGGLAQQEGFLLFEDKDGYSQKVGAGLLAQQMDARTVRLVILNACESAVAGTGDAFSSVAAALIQQAGLPAVIAYQHAMPDSSAIPFAAEFYDALTDGYPVDAAVTEGRKAILAALGDAWRERPDWATPVLFMQAQEGQILKLADRIAARQPPPVDPLDALLDDVRDVVRDRVPPERRDEAMEKMAMLRGAATERRPNLKLMESILRWSQAEVPALSGAVLSAILSLEEPLRQRGDDVWWEFQDRFGNG